MPSTGDDEPLLTRLTSGDGEPVLVSDFPAFSDTPRLSELLSAEADDRSVYRVDPLGALSKDALYLPLSQLAAACVEKFRFAGPATGRVVVVGHCSSAALSLLIAKLLACSRPVSVVLLQPSWPDEDHLRGLFAEFQTNLGAESQPCPGLDGDPRDCIASMERSLRNMLTTMAASRGLSASSDAFCDLLAWYRAWLAFILACRNEPPVSWRAGTAKVTVLTDSPDVIVVPGLEPDAYQLSTVPVTDKHGSVPAAHVKFVLEQIACA
jgi:hypothetical protein